MLITVSGSAMNCA